MGPGTASLRAINGGRRRRAAVLAVLGLLLTVVSFGPVPSVSAHDINADDENGVYDGTWPPNDDPDWQVPATNPPLDESCGIDVGILVDRSGSIADAGEQDTMRTSAQAIVDTLAGTPSRVGVWSFGNGSSSTGTGEHPAQQLTEVGGVSGPAGVASLNATIDSIPIVSGVATNWEAGFDAVHDASVAGEAPQLLFVLTDGKPTIHVGDDSSGSTTNNDDVDGGILTANSVKGDGTRIFGVGIGAGIDATTLALVANDEAWNGSNLTTAGYALTSFDDLNQTLRDLVTALCGGTVTVQKLADDGDGSFDPAAGWQFTLDPTNGALPNQTEATDDGGSASFEVDSFFVEQVNLTENLAAFPGYQLLADQIQCTNSNGPDPALTDITNGVQFDLGPTDIISCVFKNEFKFVDLNIAKSDGGFVADPGDDVTYTLTYGNAGNADAPGTVITETVPANTTVDLGGGPADGVNDGWVCGGASSGVHAAGTACTRAVGTVSAGASGLTVPFTVTVDDPVPFGVDLVTNTATIDYNEANGPDVDPSDNTATDTTPIRTNPQLEIVKTVVLAGESCPGVDGVTLTIVAGQSVTYCYVVTNPGNAAARNVVVVDDNGTAAPGDDFNVSLAGLTDQDGDTQADDLAPGATATGQSAPKQFNSPGTITNIATATANGLSDSDSAVVSVTKPAVNIVKTAVTSGGACPGVDAVTLTVVVGQSVVYCYAVSNPGNAALLNVVVVDDNGTAAPGDDFNVSLVGLTDQDGDGTADDLAAGGNATGTSAPKLFDAPGSITNIATASGNSAGEQSLTDTDNAVVNAIQPQLNIVKTATLAGGTCPGLDGITLVVDEGESVKYCYAVSNPGNAPLLNVVVRDDNGTPINPADDFTVTLAGLTDQDGDGTLDDLAAGGSASGSSAPTSFEPGVVLNVATATGNSQTGAPLTDTDTAVVQADDKPPTVDVTKTASPPSVAEPGAPVDFTVELENTSDESVSVVSITDSVEGGAPFSVTTPATPPVTATDCVTGTSIAPGATYSCQFTLTVSGNAGDVFEDLVTGVVVDDDGSTASDEDDASVTITDVPPTVDVTKTAGVLSVPEPGSPVTFTVDVENTTNETVSVVSITDSVEGGAPFSVTTPATAPVTATTCVTGTSIAPGATYTCTFTLPVSGDAGDVVNDTVVATVIDDDDSTASDEDDASVTITDVPPTVDVTKTAGVPSVPEPGAPVTFTVDVENTTNETVSVVSITDSVEGGAPFGVTTPATAPVTATTCVTGTVIAPGETYSCTFTLVVGGDAGDVIEDTVVATVVDNDDSTASDEDDAEVTVTDVPPTIDVTKTADPTVVDEPGGPVTFTVDVENTTNETVSVVSITDSVEGGAPFGVTTPATAPVTATTCVTGTVIAPGETYSCTFTLNVGGDAGDVIEDTVVATVVDNDDSTASDEDDAEVTIADVPPTIEVTKTPNVASVPEPGGPVTFTVDIENTSIESVTVTSITDSVDGGPPFSVVFPGAPPVLGTTCDSTVIAPGETYTCTFTLEVTGNAGDVVQDTVVATAVDNDGSSASDEDDAEVPVTDVPPTIEVTKDDGGASVDAPGGVVEYAVEIENTSFEPVTITSITDSIDGGEPFDVTSPATDPVLETTCETGVEIAPGETYTCTFSVEVTGVGGESVVDTVVAMVVDDDGTPASDDDDEETPVDPIADLAIEKTTPAAAFEAGGQGTYDLVVTNLGPSTAENVVVTDTLPTGLTVVSVTPAAGWSCTNTPSIVTCTVASMAVGVSADIGIAVFVALDAPTTVTNVAEVTSDTPDDNPDNNRDDVTTPVIRVGGSIELPRTGTYVMRLVGLSLLLLGGGALLVLAVRRRTAPTGLG